MKIFICIIVCLCFSISLFAQKISVHNSFHSNKAITTVDVEDDLYLRFNMGKSFEEVAKDRGISTTGKVYGLVKIYFEELELSTNVLALATPEMLSIQEFDLVFSVVMKQFYSVAMEHKDAWKLKDELLANVMAQPNNTMNTWMKAIAARAIPGQTHKAKVELYLLKDANSDLEKDMGAAICTKIFSVKVAKDALQPLYGTRIPALYQPIPDNGIVGELHQKNMGKILWSTSFIESKEGVSPKLQTTFKLAESIHGRVYLPKSIRNIGAGVGQHRVCGFTAEYYVNDVLKETVQHKMDVTTCQKETSLPLLLKSTKEGVELDELSAAFEKAIKNLKEGTHSIKVILNFDYTENEKKQSLKIASSIFKLSIPAQ